MRTSEIKRKTNETDIKLNLNLDGSGKGEINTGCGFLDHMLTLFARHGGFDDITQLLDVSGIGEKTLDNITPYITISAAGNTPVRQDNTKLLVNINTLKILELQLN